MHPVQTILHMFLIQNNPKHCPVKNQHTLGPGIVHKAYCVRLSWQRDRTEGRSGAGPQR